MSCWVLRYSSNQEHWRGRAIVLHGGSPWTSDSLDCWCWWPCPCLASSWWWVALVTPLVEISRSSHHWCLLLLLFVDCQYHFWMLLVIIVDCHYHCWLLIAIIVDCWWSVESVEPDLLFRRCRFTCFGLIRSPLRPPWCQWWHGWVGWATDRQHLHLECPDSVDNITP